MMDRAGLVGADGPTHAGSFDLAYLGCLPGFVIMAAADEAELVHMVATAAAIDDRPSAVRYPRGDGVGVEMPVRGSVLPLGKGRVLREGTTVALLSLGTRLQECMRAAEELASRGLSTTVADARFASQVLQFLASTGQLDGGLKIRPMVLPDRFIDHHKPEVQYAEAGLDAKAIIAMALSALGRDSALKPARA